MTTDAFADFYEREWSSAVRYAWVLTGSREEAEDLAQDAFMAARKSWDRVAGYERSDGWLRRVMTNRSISRRRRLGREARARLKLWPQLTLSVALPADSEHVWTAVRRLPARQLHVIALTYLEDRSDHDIAEILDIGSETVRTHRRRAQARLAELLHEDAPDALRAESSPPGQADIKRMDLL